MPGERPGLLLYGCIEGMFLPRNSYNGHVNYGRCSLGTSELAARETNTDVRML